MDSATIISHSAKQMTNQQKKNIALQVISNKTTVTEIAVRGNVSCKFVYLQKNKMTTAIDQAFEEAAPDDHDIIFNLPVTKAWIEQFALCLMLHGRASFRGTQQIIKDVLDYDISPSSIHTISVGAKLSAVQHNAKQDLSAVKLAAHDELFHLNKPVLAGVDIISLYCCLLSYEEQRDSDAWGIHFMDLQKQNFNPERVIGDDGTGLRAAHKLCFP